jgi:hypothetical protein
LIGAVGATTLKPALAVSEFTVSCAVPVLVIVTDMVAACPTVTFPNATVVELTAIVGAAPVDPVPTPVPLSETLVGEFGSLLAIVSVPVASPAAVGENRRVRGVEAPGATENGTEGETKPNPAVAETDVTFNVPAPVLLTDKDTVVLWPTFTFPKLSEVKLRLSDALAGTAVPVPLKETLAGEPASLLATRSVPAAVPADVGANLTVTVCTAFGCTVNGEDGDTTLNALPFALRDVTLSAAFPVFEIWNVCVPVPPIETLPNASELAERDSFGAVTTGASTARFTVGLVSPGN